MRTTPLLTAAVGLLSAAPLATGQTTLNAGQSEAWGANIGWVNCAGDGSHGAVIGEYVCSGNLYGANVGWINLGSGSPVNHIAYQNNAANDFGVNFQPTAPGLANLRGFAYGANIGWINFESTGNPQVSLLTGRFSGYAWSANCGWINLGDATYYVQTDHIQPGTDSDGDGIADAWEYQYFGNLGTATAATSYLQDGLSDVQKYLAGTSPLDRTVDLRILTFTPNANGSSVGLTFTSMVSRLYVIEKSPDLLSGWTDSGLGLFAPDAGTITSRTVTEPAALRGFFRLRAQRPLP